MMRKAMRQGFTLIEVLVTLILLALLVAVVFPVIVQQIEDAEPTKVASDLANIRTGMELFHLNVRPFHPGDLEDLAHRIQDSSGDADQAVDGSVFSTGATNRWKGPYIDAAIPEGTTTAGKETGDAIETGFGLQVQNDLVCYNPRVNKDRGINCGEESFVAVKLTGGTVGGSSDAEFDALDELIDDGDGNAAGKLRARDSDGETAPNGTGDEIIYYLAVPFGS